MGGCLRGGVRMVHQNHEEEKNSSEFFDCERSAFEERFAFFSSLLFPSGTAVSPKSVRPLRVLSNPKKSEKIPEKFSG